MMTITIDAVIISLMGIGNVACVFSTYSYEGHNNQFGYCDIYLLMQTILYLLFYTKQRMTSEAIDIIWHYLILFTLLLELVIFNLNVKKGHTEFTGNLWCCAAPYM